MKGDIKFAILTNSYAMTTDRLDALLKRFSVSARMFHSGALCGVHDFAPQPGQGQLHLIQRGPLRVEHQGAAAVEIADATLLFYPRPLWHRFVSDDTAGADMTCANVQFNQGLHNPLAAALPEVVVLPLEQLDGAEGALDLLFREAFGQRCGRQAIVDRLFEVILIRILRHQMDHAQVDGGLLAGMAHPQLARSLVALHDDPAAPWSLQSLAQVAGMSRTVYAETFRGVLGITPGDYVNQWRLGIAQDLLREGRALKHIVDAVGYGSVAALSRAFKTRHGVSPRAWKQNTAIT